MRVRVEMCWRTSILATRGEERERGGGVSECKCLSVLTENLTAHHGEKSAVQLDLKTTINTTTMKMGAALPPLYYSYQPEKGKRKKSYVTFNFCPFCGHKA